MVTDNAPELIEAEDEDLILPSVEDYIDNPRRASDEDLPGDLKPKRKYRSRKKEKEAVETISQSIAMMNSMFAMMVPCSCQANLPEEYQGTGAHLENCVKLYPLDENEINALAAAIGAEFEAHPDWVEKLEHADTWMAHAMLLTTVFGIIMARRMRSPQTVIAFPQMSMNGQHAVTV